MREWRDDPMPKVYDDAPTIVVGFDSEAGIVNTAWVEGVQPGEPMPATFRVMVRDYARGNEPDEHGDLYDDEEV
jgi:hypothetical protein